MISVFKLSPHGPQEPGLGLTQCAAAGFVHTNIRTSVTQNRAAAAAPRLAAADGQCSSRFRHLFAVPSRATVESARRSTDDKDDDTRYLHRNGPLLVFRPCFFCEATCEVTCKNPTGGTVPTSG